MDPAIRRLLDRSSFHIVSDLVPLIHMIKVMSLTLSPKARQRLAWMDAYRAAENAALVCRHHGIALRTFWYWKRRYDPWNLRSLEDSPQTPKRPHPKTTPRPIERAILQLKQEHPRWGKEKLALVLQQRGVPTSASTVYRICRRHARIIRYRTRKHRAPKPRVNWAEVRSPGDLLQADVKYVTFPGGRLVFQCTAIDVVSRWRWVTFADRRDQRAIMALLTIVRREAPFPIRVLQTDNGGEFGQSVTAWCRQRSIQHVFSHKRRPQENAYVERSHRMDEEEFYSLATIPSSLPDLRAQFAAYLRMANTERPHWGLDGQTPLQALRSFIPTVQHDLT